MIEHLVSFDNAQKPVKVPSGALLSEEARLAGVEIIQPCGGQGRCGRCTVQLSTAVCVAGARCGFPKLTSNKAMLWPARRWCILAVTFTNKAAREMQLRVEKLLGPDAVHGMWLGTFHAICARLMRRESDLLPVQPNFAIFDQDDQERLVKAVCRDLNLNEKLYRPASVLGSIGNAKNELILAGNYPVANYRDEVVKRVYVEYQKRLVVSNAVDFDDLLVYTAHLLEEHPEIRQKYAQRLEHVLVDEFQDTNLAQYTLIRLLSSPPSA